MSKIAKIPVIIKEGVQIQQQGQALTIAGPKGELRFSVPAGVMVTVGDEKITVAGNNTQGEQKAMLGLTRATIANMITGVTQGFEKRLELSGVGYRAQTSGSDLTLFVGFSHPVVVKADAGINFAISEGTIVISGIDKMLVGNMASRIRAIRPPEPYKGKGIKYSGEKIRRKAGKAAKTVGTK